MKTRLALGLAAGLGAAAMLAARLSRARLGISFEDRVVVTYSTRTAQCGSEPRSVEALFVRLPRIAGKKWIVERVRHSFLPVPPRTERVELPALK